MLPAWFGALTHSIVAVCMRVCVYRPDWTLVVWRPVLTEPARHTSDPISSVQFLMAWRQHVIQRFSRPQEAFLSKRNAIHPRSSMLHSGAKSTIDLGHLCRRVSLVSGRVAPDWTEQLLIGRVESLRRNASKLELRAAGWTDVWPLIRWRWCWLGQTAWSVHSWCVWTVRCLWHVELVPSENWLGRERGVRRWLWYGELP